MPITLTDRYAAELRKNSNTPNVVIEFECDGGTRRFGFHGSNPGWGVRYLADGSAPADGETFAVGSDELTGVDAALKSVSSLQNRLDPESGFSTRGRMTLVLAGTSVFAPLVRDEFLKNRRVTRKDGFLARGLSYAHYAPTFTGRVLDWSRRGEELTLVVADDLKDGSTKIPVENEAGTQFLDYRGANPVDIMKDILTTRLSIPGEYVDTVGFDSERDIWLDRVAFSRVLTDPRSANGYLNELQKETNSFIVHDGEKVSFKVFAPPLPGTSVEGWDENRHILDGTFSQKGGYQDNFFNRLVLYYDYDESGDDDPENFESAVISLDASSQSEAQWAETKTKVIKSRWIRSRTFTEAGSLTGVQAYFVSGANGTGQGTLTYTAPPERTLAWTPPGGVQGDPVRLTRNGRYRVYGADRNRYVRVVVTKDDLPDSDATDTVTITPLDGASYASALAVRLLNRYRDPVSAVSFEVDLNNIAFDGELIKPTDLKDVTTSLACGKDKSSWVGERVMLTSVRPDFSGHRASVEAIETKMYRTFGFIAPEGFGDWPGATEEERRYAFISDGDGKVGSGNVDGYYIW